MSLHATRLGKAAVAALTVAALAYGGVLALSLGASDESERAPVPRRSEPSRTAEPSNPGATLPTATPTPRVAGSDPLPAEPTQQEQAPAPPPPSTTAPGAPAPPGPAPTTEDPRFSFPPWPTPSGCEQTRWC